MNFATMVPQEQASSSLNHAHHCSRKGYSTSSNGRKLIANLVSICLCLLFRTDTGIHVNAFQPRASTPFPSLLQYQRLALKQSPQQFANLRLSNNFNNDKDDKVAALEEETKMKVWASRRKSIRKVLKFSESVKYYRIANGVFDDPSDDASEADKKDADRKAALSITAFVVAAAAVILRVGGRAALISGLGLDFASDNPELKDQLDSFLLYVHDSGPYGPLLFILAWTAVKVFCFDAAGVVLALASGIMVSRAIAASIDIFESLRVLFLTTYPATHGIPLA